MTAESRAVDGSRQADGFLSQPLIIPAVITSSPAAKFRWVQTCVCARARVVIFPQKQYGPMLSATADKLSLILIRFFSLHRFMTYILINHVLIHISSRG